MRTAGGVRRRTALWTLGAGVWARRAGGREARAADATTGDEFAVNAYEDLTVYRDRGKKFLLKFPKKWTVGSKPGAAVLFKNPDAKYSNIGVTVSPVTVKTLDKFGSLNEIGDRLANAEQAKESTVPGGVTLTRSDARVGSVSGTTFYDYEYRLITTYGNKRVTTSVTIVDSTLYILNAQYFETADPERPTDPQLALDQYNLALHRKVAESFDAGKAAFPSIEIEAEELRGDAPMIADGMGK
ncbi:hypothetical protein BE221DRAFT_142290 [Ostreococcus tauri]|uniref:PsbP C-terminal domain-containing protein n=1 Tax=Ostreococcus tauri TaxID=70448 RepID=A0A1Y5I3I0_OSTTA|nr:hypothetical protein BE221DRAFT_142290 [Ostreococcus tauri]